MDVMVAKHNQLLDLTFNESVVECIVVGKSKRGIRRLGVCIL